MKPTTLRLATWADYADVVNQRMTILRTYAYADVESIPCTFKCLVAIQIEIDDLQPPMTLRLRMQDYEGKVVAETAIPVSPQRTLTDRCVAQVVAELQFQMEKHEYSLEISQKENGFVIGNLPLPVVTAAMKAKL